MRYSQRRGGVSWWLDCCRYRSKPWRSCTSRYDAEPGPCQSRDSLPRHHFPPTDWTSSKQFRQPSLAESSHAASLEHTEKRRKIRIMMRILRRSNYFWNQRNFYLSWVCRREFSEKFFSTFLSWWRLKWAEIFNWKSWRNKLFSVNFKGILHGILRISVFHWIFCELNDFPFFLIAF